MPIGVHDRLCLKSVKQSSDCKLGQITNCRAIGEKSQPSPGKSVQPESRDRRHACGVAALLTALNAESCFAPRTWQVTGQSKTEDFELPDPSKLLQVSVKLVSVKLESADSGIADRPSA